jgi:hypothetical protein
MTVWRVLLNHKLWKQEEYERLWDELPEVHRFAQSKGRCAMRIVPQKGDTILFVIQGRIRMKGIALHSGFRTGSAHREHSCNTGAVRAHAEVDEYTWIKITEIRLSEPIDWKGQRTWAKLSE